MHDVACRNGVPAVRLLARRFFRLASLLNGGTVAADMRFAALACEAHLALAFQKTRASLIG